MHRDGLTLEGRQAAHHGLVGDQGRPMDNAFWNGAFVAFGDGVDVFLPLAGALDVAAHEMTHGVIERTVNLAYRFESGALNESFADVFATMVDRDERSSERWETATTSLSGYARRVCIDFRKKRTNLTSS